MSNNIDLKKIWNMQESEIPKTKDLFKKANQFKSNNLYKLLAANIAAVVTSIAIGFIWYYYQPELLTTKIGIVLVIVAMILFIIAYNDTIPLLLKNNLENNSKQYLQQLLLLKRKQLFLQKTILNSYFILLLLGISLYMIEYTSKMTIVWGVFSYGITLLWIAINWFFFRPRVIKKQQSKINTLISKFRKVNDQFND